MRTFRTALVTVLIALGAAGAGDAQSRRPQAQLTATVETASIRPGTEAQLLLRVKLPGKVHVQSNKPTDPLFIPTELKVAAPRGITVMGIVFPPAELLTQAGLKEPLIVLGSEFTVRVKVKVASGQKPGDLLVPAQLRYQACDDTTCYPPATADVSWAVKVGARKAS